MKRNVKSNERIHCKIQVCLQNLAFRKLKKSIEYDRAISNETMNTSHRTNSNSKPLNFESSSTEFSTSKERVDLLQNFQPQELRVDIRSHPKYIHKKDIVMPTNAKVFFPNARFSLPILRLESLENTSHSNITYPKSTVKNELNVEHNGDMDVTINEINREISKKETVNNVSCNDDSNKEVHEKKSHEIGDTAKLVSQDVSRVEETPNDNPIMVEERSTDLPHYLKRGSHKRHSTENKITFDESIQFVPKLTNKKYNSLEDSTLDLKFYEARSSLREKDCTTMSSGFIDHIEHYAQGKKIAVDRRKDFSPTRKSLVNKHDNRASSYLATSINENIKDNSLYQCIRHYCAENMINDLSRFQCCYEDDYNEPYRQWHTRKGILSGSRNEHRHCVCRVRGNSSISCECKCKVTPSSQRVTFCLPGKKKTT